MTESASSPDQSQHSTTQTSGGVNTIHISKPLGHTLITALLCGGVGAVLGITLELLKRFDGIRVSLLETYQSEPILMSDPYTWSPAWSWIAAVMLGIATAYVVLDSIGKWRRVFFGLMVVVLLVSFSPLLMLWDIFWVPCVELTAVLWAWMCAFFYASQHVMPCELGIPLKVVRKKNVTKNSDQESITLTPLNEESSRPRFSRLKGLIKRKPKTTSDSNPLDQLPDA